MKSIHYANDELLTGDDIADALVDLAESLAKRNTSLAVRVPIRFAAGDVRDVNFLLGPASQLVAVPMSSSDEDQDVDELERRAIVAQLRAQISSVGGVHAVAFEPDELPANVDDL